MFLTCTLLRRAQVPTAFRRITSIGTVARVTVAVTRSGVAIAKYAALLRKWSIPHCFCHPGRLDHRTATACTSSLSGEAGVPWIALQIAGVAGPCSALWGHVVGGPLGSSGLPSRSGKQILTKVSSVGIYGTRLF